MKVVDLGVPNLKDVAANLHTMADSLASLDGEPLTAVVLLLRGSQRVQVYAYGSRASGLEVQGILTRAGHVVSNRMDEYAQEQEA